MDNGLEADLLKIPKDISKMWEWATTLRKPSAQLGRTSSRDYGATLDQIRYGSSYVGKGRLGVAALWSHA